MAAPPPLKGIKVLEFAGLAPGPFAGMLLADAGASVLRVDRASPGSVPARDMLARHKSSIVVDLKRPDGVALLKELTKDVDVVIDPFRPGVLEKLGLGPDVLLALNPRLVYGRMTGFRRDGRYADMAGHDINYIAVSGALSLLGRADEKPHPPINILGDFAGGGAMLAQAILLALFSRQNSGKGQVVEANMVDGSAYLATFPRMLLKTPMGSQPRGRNMLDGGSPWYDTYETKDGKYMSVGALEPQFFAALVKGLGLQGQGWEEGRADPKNSPRLAKLFEETFKSKTRSEWEAIFDGTDACCTPVLEHHELESDPSREGDQRPAFTLKDTPCLAVKQHDTGASVPEAQRAAVGQGSGSEGDGYGVAFLEPGEGAQDTLREWVGWREGSEYEIRDGGMVLKGKAASKL